MFSGCEKEDNNGNNGGIEIEIGMPFAEYDLPENLYLEGTFGTAVLKRLTKIGNDYLSGGGNVAASYYCLKYNADTKKWREYIKIYMQDWTPLEEYTETEIIAKLKEDRYLGFTLEALDGKGFARVGLDGVSLGTKDENDDWKYVTRSVVAYSDGTTTLCKDIEYGIVLETKVGETSVLKLSFIGTKDSFEVALPL